MSEKSVYLKEPVCQSVKPVCPSVCLSVQSVFAIYSCILGGIGGETRNVNRNGPNRCDQLVLQPSVNGVAVFCHIGLPVHVNVFEHRRFQECLV